MQESSASTTECYSCNVCGLALPIRLPRPGEVATSWECRFCGSRFYATLIDDSPPNVLTNVRPADDVHPRISIGSDVLAQLHKRDGRPGRDFDERHFHRVQSGVDLTLIIEGRKIATQSIDLSAGGVGFISPTAVEIGAIITARFESVPGKPSAICTVRNCTPRSDGRYRIGAEFRV